MTIKSFVLGALLASAVFAGIVVAKDGLGVTNVRVGTAAAIGIAASADGQTVYVVNGNGLFKSTDGGDHWRRLEVD